MHTPQVAELTCEGLELLGFPLLDDGVCQAVVFPFTMRTGVSNVLDADIYEGYRVHVNEVRTSHLCVRGWCT